MLKPTIQQAWYGLVWLGMAWCSGTFKLMSFDVQKLAFWTGDAAWWLADRMMAMGPTAIRLFDLKYLGGLAVGQQKNLWWVKNEHIVDKI